MKKLKNDSPVQVVDLPWSDGSLSARLWKVGDRTVVGVPELGLHCYGASQSEAVFRLFTALLKYYRQLRAFEKRLPKRALQHLELLSFWVRSIEKKMSVTSEESNNVVSMRRKR